MLPTCSGQTNYLAASVDFRAAGLNEQSLFSIASRLNGRLSAKRYLFMYVEIIAQESVVFL